MVSSTQLQVGFSNFQEYRLYYQATHRGVWTRRAHVFGTAVAAVGALIAALRLDFRLMASAVMAGYLISWGGDITAEGKQPASFQHPLWALRANLDMVQDVMRGKERV